ncbi:MAG: ThuA domain-containing protein [Planctomycetes bacterium]|nr:ThuA domain-containing protein [Planctomycetota bacterium]
MKFVLNAVIAIVLGVSLATAASAQGKGEERDIFNYVAQKKAGKDVKKIIFIADPDTHGGKGNHEFKAGAIYMARVLNARYPNCYAVVHLGGRWPGGALKVDNQALPKKSGEVWPKDIGHADCYIVLLNHARQAALDKDIAAAVERGAGFMAIHYGVEVSKGKQGDNFLKWIGGYFETFWSVNPHWTPKFDKIPEHETTRGVKPFSINDEWYYHMRFVEGMKGVTPVLSAVADVKTVTGRWDGKKAGAHNGNPDVLEAVKAGKPQHVAWAYVRPDGGRGFGFTGYHNYKNLQNDSFRTLLLNAAAWTAKLDVPAEGIRTETPNDQELDRYYVEGLRMLR